MAESGLIERIRSADDDDKVEAIAALDDHAGDPGVIAFLTEVTADPGEYDLARIECMKILRLWPPAVPGLGREAGRAIVVALTGDDDLVRQHAAMSLGPYLHDPVVFEALTAAVSHDDDLSVRHNALAALAEAEPTERTAELLHRLAGDPELGAAVARIRDR